MSYEALASRLVRGRPLVLDADTLASFRARGVAMDTPGAVGELLRRDPEMVKAHYAAEVESDVNVLCALTADTTPRALAEVGMQHRSALLTGLAVDLAFEVTVEAARPVVVAGVLGSEMIAPMAADRLQEELTEHALRIATAGVEVILARGQGSLNELMAAVAAGKEAELPVWAIVECAPGGELAVGGSWRELVAALSDAGARAIVFEVSSVDDGIQVLEGVREEMKTRQLFPGVLLASSAESVRGFPNGEEPEIWAARALELDTHGARIIGGGAGTTEAHTEALVTELRALHPSIRPPA